MKNMTHLIKYVKTLNNHMFYKNNEIHYVLKGTDENPCMRTKVLLRIDRMAVLLRILRPETHFAALDAKVMRIPI